MWKKIYFIFIIVAISHVFGRQSDSTSFSFLKKYIQPDQAYKEYDEQQDSDEVESHDYSNENEDIDNYPYHYPNYVYKYGVDDHDSKDFKTQQESRDGDVVKGSYSVMQPDGKMRIVRYTADEKNGFNADVVYENGSLD